MKIKTIDITAKEWFDRVNGNSYHSVRTVINYGMKDERVLVSSFTYGYDSAYLQTATRELQKAGLVEMDERTALWRYCEDQKIILRTNKIEKCKKREVVEFGAN